ncbi:MAG: hypothetical protein Q8Q31_00860 [Nanoarchaeota archaeon]|nr:hypothetical protein [Nanoarchaeota archaeon]
MKALQTLVMPAKCAMCGELFDLSYDLEGVKEGKLEGGWNTPSLSRIKGHLCWVCRLRGK